MDFIAKHSNCTDLKQPIGYCQLDRSLIVQADSNIRARRIVPKLINIIHELGAHVVCEGIGNVGAACSGG